MIVAYIAKNKLIPLSINPSNAEMLNEALWIDLLVPSKEEEDLVEKHLDLDIPTREEMREIELSSRLYTENNILFMTATMLAQADSIVPKYDAVTFILTETKLITIRYIEPLSFKMFTAKLPKLKVANHLATRLFIGLLDATVDRLADILEIVGHHLDEYSKAIFRPDEKADNKLNYLDLLQQIGARGDLNTTARESLVTFNRLITFFSQSAITSLDKVNQSRLATLSKDISALSDHANFLSNKINFLLDATLGMVNIEQNNIIKIFSVAAVIFLPPTLIASIYGMNFTTMPELHFKYGYLYAIFMMLLSSWLPYKYFKSRKWL